MRAAPGCSKLPGTESKKHQKLDFITVLGRSRHSQEILIRRYTRMDASTVCKPGHMHTHVRTHACTHTYAPTAIYTENPGDAVST